MPEQFSPLYVFIHIPKTGGTTISGHLRNELDWDVEFVHLGPWGEDYRARNNLTPFADRPEEVRMQARVLAGHDATADIDALVPGSSTRYLTFVRDPADRLVSVYNFRTSKPENADLSFEDWYETVPPNPMFRWLRRRLNVTTMADLKDTLREFWFLGTTDHLDDDLPGVFAAIGVPTTWENRRVIGSGASSMTGLDHHDADRVLTRQLTIDDELRDRIYTDHPKDLALYRFANKRRQRLLDRGVLDRTTTSAG